MAVHQDWTARGGRQENLKTWINWHLRSPLCFDCALAYHVIRLQQVLKPAFYLQPFCHFFWAPIQSDLNQCLFFFYESWRWIQKQLRSHDWYYRHCQLFRPHLPLGSKEVQSSRTSRALQGIYKHDGKRSNQPWVLSHVLGARGRNHSRSRWHPGVHKRQVSNPDIFGLWRECASKHSGPLVPETQGDR